jgi:DNA-binding beta-propeller fold protein YncE
VSSADGGVRVLDGQRARIVATGVRPTALAADGRHVVAVDAGTGTLLRLRPPGAAVKLGGTPVDVAIAGNSAWVTDPAAGTVRRVDLAGGVPGPPIRVGRAPVAIAADTRAVYVLCRGDRTLVRIDPASGKVREQVELRAQPAALALGPDHVWIAAGANEVIRVDR